MTTAALRSRPMHAPPPGAAELDMVALFRTGRLVEPGGRHLRRRQNNQDHAVVIQQREAIVLAVADGASVVDGLPSRAEVGAALAAELAAMAASEAAGRGLGPGEIRLHVASTLVQRLAPLWRALGDAGPQLLHATLILAVSTHEFTSIWCAGDGSWGARGSLAHGRQSPAVCRGASLGCYTMPAGDGSRSHEWLAFGRQEMPTPPRTVGTLARGFDVEAFARGLEPVLEAEGPALSMFVASDGIDDEPAACGALRLGRVGTAADLGALLLRSGDSDDLGVAWATERRRNVSTGGAA